MSWADRTHNKNYENDLYEAMERTLLLLKEIHESKGEIVEDYNFQKREFKQEVIC